VTDYSEYELDIVELYFQEQYISRRDMWQISKQMNRKSVYSQKEITLQGINFKVQNLLQNNQNVYSGIIMEKTKFIYRSKSTRQFILVRARPDPSSRSRRRCFSSTRTGWSSGRSSSIS
jgi:hypothetical protein